ncbi:Rsd/AlgQ family anti-sigma factor [Shimwellia blattae]|uniref:Regulator of sigma D n=1 Tax=Shimwellia blattae (strain ATCC 29907 / DSM 4481 / JCM 1650 / NBRC 105725 / CDC 9005-74) TaxID=630626 RepID=I2BE05_SHIBC|nr:Rsd/AlgQ family anti-sigma factor [Shimwellia blattae]AFJ48759.1 regulator of sigma D [Shimwellia blattae DSM 4481 = NBRC 105725]GAB83072.1 sigma-D factor regulatory protein [Shimwellia blattae DSM 4481 = NBRC 105725]VDY66245.1 Regulator of sigma D [Shimwellia blattae]VEC27494.1 Regulator of sigma D [Shimwellia blattae]
MLNQLKSLTERLNGNNTLVDQWLLQRKHLLIAWYNLVGLTPGKSSLAAIDEMALDAFCQGLVDYLSAGHFHIYARIIGEIKGNYAQLATSQICPQLEANTQQIMAYYDLHLESALEHDDFAEFQQALSGLGEAMETRFALEDKLMLMALELSRDLSANDGNPLTRPA